jgi:histidyl-tRNA synthetase
VTNGGIAPRTLRGFRDLLPDETRAQNFLIDRARASFESFGYEPIQTPALEYAEILKGKGGGDNEHQMFEFTDAGGRDVGMRFDLTLPLSRYVAQHENELTFPFRAYHVGYVWRGDRPQRGRFRELIQCDADMIGASGPAADAEILAVYGTTVASFELGEFRLRTNDRRVLNGIFRNLGLAGDRLADALRTLDKLDKIGAPAVAAGLAELGLEEPAARKAVDELARPAASNDEMLERLARLTESDAEGEEAVENLSRVSGLAVEYGLPPEILRIDPSIARGLDYYTGIVFETTLLSAPEVGSIGSGGRYDSLSGLYGRTAWPGVGGSIGISRILSAVGDDVLRRALRPLVVVGHGGDELLPSALSLARSLRAEGLRVEVYPTPRKHDAQLKYAASRRATLFASVDGGGEVWFRNLERGSTARAPLGEAAAAIVATLSGPGEP